MSDLSAVMLFVICLASTFALVWACEWLRPRDARPPANSQPGAAVSEARR